MDNRKELLKMADKGDEEVDIKTKFEISISHDGRNYLCRLPKDLVQSLELIPELDDKEINKDDNSHIPKDWKLEVEVTNFEKREGNFKIIKR